jgi:hypothetical protein
MRYAVVICNLDTPRQQQTIDLQRLSGLAVI